MCHKLKNSSNEIEWRNCSFVLASLKCNEKTFLKIYNNYDSYKERLSKSPEVKAYFI